MSSLISKGPIWTTVWPDSIRARSSRSFTMAVMRLFSSMTMAKYFGASSWGMVPSCMASRKPRMEVKGDRSSWDTLATKLRRACSRLLRASAIRLKLLPSWATSSWPWAGMRRLKAPLENRSTVAFISMMGLVIRPVM